MTSMSPNIFNSRYNEIEIYFEYLNDIHYIVAEKFHSLREIKQRIIRKIFHIPKNVHCFYKNRDLYQDEEEQLETLFPTQYKVTIKLRLPSNEEKKNNFNTINADYKPIICNENNMINSLILKNRKHLIDNVRLNTVINNYEDKDSHSQRNILLKDNYRSLDNNHINTLKKIKRRNLKLNSLKFRRNNLNIQLTDNNDLKSIDENKNPPTPTPRTFSSEDSPLPTLPRIVIHNYLKCEKNHDDNREDNMHMISKYCRICQKFICEKCSLECEHHNHILISINTDDQDDIFSSNFKNYYSSIKDEVNNAKRFISQSKEIKKIKEKILIQKDRIDRMVSELMLLYERVEKILSLEEYQRKWMNEILNFETNISNLQKSLKSIFTKAQVYKKKINNYSQKEQFEKTKHYFKLLNEKENEFNNYFKSDNLKVSKLLPNINKNIYDFFDNMEKNLNKLLKKEKIFNIDDEILLEEYNSIIKNSEHLINKLINPRRSCITFGAGNFKNKNKKYSFISANRDIINEEKLDSSELESDSTYN